MNLFRFTLFCYTLDITAEETMASSEAQLKQALEKLNEVSKQVQVAQARLEEVEKLKTPPPAFVKVKRKNPREEQKKACKERDARQNRGRPRSTPTRDSWSIGCSRAPSVICVHLSDQEEQPVRESILSSTSASSLSG
jgi:hypothetical protein